MFSPLKITKHLTERENSPPCLSMTFCSTPSASEGISVSTAPVWGGCCSHPAEMTKPKGLSCAADPCGGVVINFIQCLYEHGVCIIILHHCISDLEGWQDSWAQSRYQCLSGGADDIPAEFSSVCVFFSRITVQMKKSCWFKCLLAYFRDLFHEGSWAGLQYSSESLVFIAEITGCAARELMFAVMETCCLGTWLMRQAEGKGRSYSWN